MKLSADLMAATTDIGAAMRACDACPFCGAQDLDPVSCRNDLHRIDGVSASLRESDYHVCQACSLVFARRRQSTETIAPYYQWFAHLENRDYAVYPPPQPYIDGKAARAAGYIGYFSELGLLAPGMTIAHIRCDVGSLLSEIRNRYSDCTLHGLDYFESNVRYANEKGLAGVNLLDPAGVNLPQGTAYDVIVCNHIFTHAFDPRADLKKLFSALKPGGVLFLYNEVDHQLRFQPKGLFYQWVALNNFHKQLLTPLSLEQFLISGGFDIEARNHQKFYMEFLARKNTPAGEAGRQTVGASQAKAEASTMKNNFRRWAALQDSPFHGVVKISGKLKRKFSSPS